MKRRIKQYILSTYLMFFLFIGIIGLVMVTTKNVSLVAFLQIISAWTPNFVFLLMYKKIYPESTRIGFIKEQIFEKIKPFVLIAAILLPLLVFLGSLIFINMYNKIPFDELIIQSPIQFAYMLPSHLVRGPLGEELGWRAFLLTEIQKKNSIIKSGVIVGLIWGFWHFPLWLVSGFTGIDLIVYIISFLVAIICCSIIITILYTKCRNILIAGTVHLLNNYLLGLFTYDILHVLVVFAAFYLLITGILIAVQKKDFSSNL